MRTAATLLITLAILLGGAGAQQPTRLERDVDLALRGGRGKLLETLLATPPAEMGSALTAQVVHALIASGSHPTSNLLAPILRRLAATPSPRDPEATIHRIEALVAAGAKTWGRAIEQNLAILYELQQADGSFRSPRPEKDRERPGPAALTAAAVLAWRAAALAGLEIIPGHLERAGRFLLGSLQRDGGVAERGRRHRMRSSGRATAAALSAWTWLRTRAELEELHPELEKAIDRAEAWLRRKWSVDRNPGSPNQLFPYLVELERSSQLLLLAPPEEKRRNRRLDGFLVGYQLPTSGWNHRATLMDLRASPPNPGGGPPRGVAPLVQLVYDPADTAQAVLSLADATAPSAAELRFALERRLARASRLPARESFEGFVAMLARRPEVSVPALIGYLMAPDRAVRYFAMRALRSLTGKEFGYDPRRKVASNREAIQRWQAWWLSSKKK